MEAMLGVPRTPLTALQALTPPTMPHAIPRGQQGQARAAQPLHAPLLGQARPAVDPGEGPSWAIPSREQAGPGRAQHVLIKGTDAGRSLPRGMGFSVDPEGEGWPCPCEALGAGEAMERSRTKGPF